jgi:opine dehydrogenase
MGGIQASGQISGFAAIETITTDPGEAVADADLVMVVLPATGHREIAQRLAPHLHDGQVVLLNPGRAGGALEFLHVLRETGTHAQPLVAEAQTLLYSCRDINPGSVHVFGVKNAVPLAAIPAFATPDVLALVNRCLPQFAACDNVFKTSLDNIGFVFHPALTVLNAAWIEERHGDFEYYREGASPSVARCLEALDAERVSVATALGVGGTSARQWLYMAYGATGKDLYEAIQANPGYQGIKAPNRLAHRYVSEDVPMSLVPIASLGEHLGLNMTTTRAIIHLASLALQTDYWAQGRTVQRLGVDRLSGPEIVRRAVEGDWPN